MTPGFSPLSTEQTPPNRSHGKRSGEALTRIAPLLAAVLIVCGVLATLWRAPAELAIVLRWCGLGLLLPFALRRRSLLAWTFLAMLAGAELGADAPSIAVGTQIVSEIFLRLIRAIVAPLIFGGIVTGIAGHGELKGVGRVALKAIVFFEVVTTLGLILGLIGLAGFGGGNNNSSPNVGNVVTPVYDNQGRPQATFTFSAGFKGINISQALQGEAVVGYLIYRGTSPDFTADITNLQAFVDARNTGSSSSQIKFTDPALTGQATDTGVEVIEFLDGYRACTNGDMKKSEIITAVMGVQNAFHAIEPLPLTKTIFDMIDEHGEQVRQLGVRMPPNFELVMREYEAARAVIVSSGMDIVPCHNDPMPGNFLIAEGKPMMLVDYEFASNNERAYELGLTLCEFFYDERRVFGCVEEVYGRVEWSTLARVQVCIALADIKWGMWGCVNQRLNDTWDFDYHKYGTWKFGRAAAKVADPRWPLWLASV